MELIDMDQIRPKHSLKLEINYSTLRSICTKLFCSHRKFKSRN